MTTMRTTTMRLICTILCLQQTLAFSGIYRPFLEHAWNRLEESGILIPTAASEELVPSDLSSNEAVAKGMPEGTKVKISVDAKRGKAPVRYGRFALLETILPDNSGTVNTKGIQVLNLVVFGAPPLPVWGVDMVSLPGDKHLLLLDVQPMVLDKETVMNDQWAAWHDKHVKDKFEWGGDLPEAAKPFFSSNTLWTRLTGPEAVEKIQGPIFEAFCEHLELYIECVSKSNCNDAVATHHQAEYLNYRLTNDPARPMLQSLYGLEWTERVLEEVMFPKDRVLS